MALPPQEDPMNPTTPPPALALTSCYLVLFSPDPVATSQFYTT